MPAFVETQTWRCVNTLCGHSAAVRSVAVSPDNKTLASGSKDNSIKIWNVTNGKNVTNLYDKTTTTNWVYVVAFCLDGERLVSGSSRNKKVKLWNLETLEEVNFSGHSQDVRTVAISPDGQTIASGSIDKTIRLWDLRTRQEIKKLSGHKNSITSVAFSPDGQFIISGSYDGKICLWDWNSNNPIR